MYSPDFQTVAEYITALTGNVDTPVAWQLIYDPDKAHQGNPNFTATLQEAWPHLVDAQNKQFGVFVTVNQTDGNGRKLENITGVRAVFADWDDMAQPRWDVTPHFVVKRSETQGHAYWLTSDVQLDEFAELQKRTALKYNTDQSVINVDRVMRVPGTWHFKNPAMPGYYSFEYNLTAELPRYGSEQYRSATVLQPEQENALFSWLARSERKSDGLDELDDDPQSMASFLGYLKTCPVAVDGSGSAQQTVISTASVGWDYGLTVETVREMMYQHYNPRCIPPWSTSADQRLFDRCIVNAYRYAKNAPGCRTVKGAFTGHIDRQYGGAIPEPVEGWEANAKQKKKKADNTPSTETEVAVPQDDGSFLSMTITNKTNPWDKARVFLQTTYPKGRLLHTDKAYFTYDDKIWQERDDDDLDAQIAMFYQDLKLPPTQIKGIFDSVRRMSHCPGLQQNTWIPDGSEAHSVTVFNNGIVDISQPTPGLKAHTHDLFTVNALDYDFDMSAQCPEWQKFLTTIWGDDQELKDQLQEWMGYLMTRDTSYQKFALLIGKPRGGKGTITSVIESLIGDFNCAAPSLEDLTKDSILDDMSKKPVALIPDAHSVSPIKRDAVLGVLKAIVGNDPKSFDRKYKKASTVRFYTRFVLSANDMPSFRDPSGALAARMLVFPFRRSFVGREDRQLVSRLLLERQGIANWAIAGLQRLRQRGQFTEAAAGLEQLEIIQEDMFPLAGFVDDCMTLEQDTRTSTKDIYAVYQAWCMMEGIKLPMTQTAVHKQLSASPLPISQCRMTHGNRARGFQGVRINDAWQGRLGGGGNVTPFPMMPPVPPVTGGQHG